MKGSFKTALIAAVVSAFVAAGAAVATTQTFVLGTTNNVNAASTVTATGSGLNTKMLQLTNNNTGSSATALGLTTAASRPPMIVSSGAKVVNLNVDKLDGIDSANFVQGRGRTQFVRKILAPGGSASGFFALSGIGAFDAKCNAGPSAELDWSDPAGVEGSYLVSSGTTIFTNAVVPGVIYEPGTTGLDAVVTMWQFWTTDGKHRATVWFTHRYDGTNCVFSASALMQSA